MSNFAVKKMNLGKELKETLYFAFSFEFLRMGVLWTVALLYSYWQLVIQTLFGGTSNTYTRCTPQTTGLTRPVCIITGVCYLPFPAQFQFYLLPCCICLMYFIALYLQATSGLGAAAATALSREGFYVVLGTLLSLIFLWYIPLFFGILRLSPQPYHT